MLNPKVYVIHSMAYDPLVDGPKAEMWDGPKTPHTQPESNPLDDWLSEYIQDNLRRG